MDFMGLCKIFNLEYFVLHCNSILCFCNPLHHKNAESHESMKMLTLEIFRFFGNMNKFVYSDI